jgi:hypothetical protein
MREKEQLPLALPVLVQSDSRASAGTGNARAMGDSDARARDVGETVIAALHPLARLGTSGNFERGAGRLAVSFRTLRGSPDLLRKLRSSTRIECDDRVNVSRVKKASTIGSIRTPRRSRSTFRGSEARQCACGRPEVGRWPSAS